MTTIEIFKKMYDWLCTNRGIVNQVEVARAAGLNEVTVSRILNNQVKKASMETLHKVNAAYGNVFNPAWLRGESNVMLSKDTMQQHITQTNTDAQGLSSFTPSVPAIDAFTAALLATKEEVIAELRNRLAGTIADKDGTIAAQKRELAAKDALIKNLQQTISDLSTQLAMEKGVLSGTSPSVPANPKPRPRKNV